jgi:hypothetical protein
VVADSAFPVYAQPGIETIVVNDDLSSVLKYVANSISSSRHVRATVFLDKELQFIDERDYPGVSQLKRQIAATFAENQVSSIPHAEVMNRIDEAEGEHSVSCSSDECDDSVYFSLYAFGLWLHERRNGSKD